MKATEKLKKYRLACTPGQYDHDVYLDLEAIRNNPDFSFAMMPLVINILEHYYELEFNEHDIFRNMNYMMTRENASDHLQNLKSLGYIED